MNEIISNSNTFISFRYHSSVINFYLTSFVVFFLFLYVLRYLCVSRLDSNRDVSYYVLIGSLYVLVHV